MPWKKLYESCVSETNPDKLKKLVFQLEDAIVLRCHDLLREPNKSRGPRESDELQALRRVAQQLCQLKIEKFEWPQPAAAAAPAMPALLSVRIPAAMPALIETSVPAPATTEVEPLLPPTARRTVASRIQSALRVTQRAWENWVFKSLK